MSDIYDLDYADDDYYGCPDENEPWEDEDDGDPCSECGPHCQYWGGDGLCMLEINYLAACHQFYEEHYQLELQRCPICGQYLTLYKIPIDQLWQWPGDWLTPMIALNIYAVYDAPKGVVHSAGDLHHIWVGEGEFRRECLIALNCVRQDPDPDWLYA